MIGRDGAAAVCVRVNVVRVSLLLGLPRERPAELHDALRIKKADVDMRAGGLLAGERVVGLADGGDGWSAARRV